MREVRVRTLRQLEVRNTELPAPNRGHMFDVTLLERVAKGMAANHTCRTYNDESLHGNARSSTQST